jgi:hypothetical protein
VSLCPQDFFCPSAGTGRYRQMPVCRPGLACRPSSNRLSLHTSLKTCQNLCQDDMNRAPMSFFQEAILNLHTWFKKGFRRFLRCLPRPQDAGTPRALRLRVIEEIETHLFHTNRRSGRDSNLGRLNSSLRSYRLSHPLGLLITNQDPVVKSKCQT